jgi:hypothetical protein
VATVESRIPASQKIESSGFMVPKENYLSPEIARLEKKRDSATGSNAGQARLAQQVMQAGTV